MYKSKYANLMQHLMNEHDLILLDSEQQEIEKWLDKDLKAINYTRCCMTKRTVKIMDKQKQFKDLLKNSRPLTEEEVQELRNKAKKYAESGGKYLDKQETK